MSDRTTKPTAIAVVLVSIDFPERMLLLVNGLVEAGSGVSLLTSLFTDLPYWFVPGVEAKTVYFERSLVFTSWMTILGLASLYSFSTRKFIKQVSVVSLAYHVGMVFSALFLLLTKQDNFGLDASISGIPRELNNLLNGISTMFVHGLLGFGFIRFLSKEKQD